MSFYKLNQKKILPIFGLIFLITGILFLLILFLIIVFNKNIDLLNDTLNYIFLTIFFTLLIFENRYSSASKLFNSKRKMIEYISTLNILDNNQYTIFNNQNTKCYIFTKVEYLGKISDYPTLVTFSQRRNKGGHIRYHFVVYFNQFNQIYKDSISFPLDFFDKPSDDMPIRVKQYVENLHVKNYVKADFNKVLDELSK